MTPQERARETRLLLDRLAEDAAVAENIAKKLPEPEPNEKIAPIHKAPSALRAWAEQLGKGYAVARDEANTPTEHEAAYQATLEKAHDVLRQAQEARNDIAGRCKHRTKLEDPIINEGNGAALYPDKPTCLVCGEEFELEWYCRRAPTLRCEYYASTQTPPHVHGDYVARQLHKMDDPEERDKTWAVTIKCVHCGQPWSRER